jgi:hypothetical protein
MMKSQIKIPKYNDKKTIHSCFAGCTNLLSYDERVEFKDVQVLDMQYEYATLHTITLKTDAVSVLFPHAQ